MNALMCTALAWVPKILTAAGNSRNRLANAQCEGHTVTWSSDVPLHEAEQHDTVGQSRQSASLCQLAGRIFPPHSPNPIVKSAPFASPYIKTVSPSWRNVLILESDPSQFSSTIFLLPFHESSNMEPKLEAAYPAQASRPKVEVHNVRVRGVYNY